MEMEAGDMLDVLHFLFEEDNHYVSEESQTSRSGLRVTMYRDLYGTEYKYAVSTKKTQTSNSSDLYDGADLGYMSDSDASKPFKPKGFEEVKPYVPASDFDPYAERPFDGLDAPMN